MRPSLLLLLAAVAGCSPNFQKRAVGVWRVDPATLQGAAIKQDSDRFRDGQFEFREDGTVRASGFGKSGFVGRWLVDERRIVLSPPMPEQQAVVPTLTFSEDAKRIRLELPGGRLRCDLVREK